MGSSLRAGLSQADSANDDVSKLQCRCKLQITRTAHAVSVASCSNRCSRQRLRHVARHVTDYRPRVETCQPDSDTIDTMFVSALPEGPASIPLA